MGFIFHGSAVDYSARDGARRFTVLWKRVLRAVSNLLLSLLMVATLLWGGCVSCSRFFMFPSAKSDCCNKGQCERPTKNAPQKECNRMPLGLQGATHVHADLAVVSLVATVDVVQPPAPARFAVTRDTVILEHSPPDLNVLNATFLI